ncbi:acyl-CoA thioesterase [Dethiobacter alkaliphilus]|uniref:Thioesterase-like protein n=1 Tax=Dethiobacter alkaliphilus AHT 1 TaxID=555088 RepID=C0GFL1_DETAL|nr:thioesterase family protein [Dethiobacter alkaliphilus]EEG77971.1 thioesterase-like protein [Dethiobacter alkaliphilus AHT 1]
MAGNYYAYHHVVTPQDATVLGIAYDARYLDWACIARERMIVENGDLNQIEWPAFLTGEVSIRYLYPVFLNESVEVRVSIGDYSEEQGRARLIFRYVNKNGRLLAEGHQIIFFVNHATGIRTSLPPTFVNLARQFSENQKVTM